MADYIDAHTHIHMTAAESRGFLERRQILVDNFARAYGKPS